MNKKIKAINAQQEINVASSELTRARSITVGTAFGGTVELSMRSNDGAHLWCVMQPVEIIELIHQFSAAVGCHIHIQPRKDFSSWRNWKYTDEELAHYRGQQLGKIFSGAGWPPHSNDLDPHKSIGAKLPPPEVQPGLNIERGNHEPVAIEKTIKRRSTKRAATTS